MSASLLSTTRWIRRAVGRRAAWTIVAWCLALCSAGVAGAAPAADDHPASDPPVAYRRVFVPADDVEAWPRDGEKYLPVETRDFDAWVAAASAEPAAAQVAEAEYSARLDGDRLVDGHAEWRIEHRGQGTAWLPLDSLAIVVRSPAWRDERSAARLGAWQQGDGPLVYGLQVARAGTLQFAWHSVSSHRSQTTVEIPLGFPPATTKRLVLDLPAGKRPVVDGAVVLETTDVARPVAVTETAGVDPPRAWRRWKLALGAPVTAQLRIEDQRARPVATRPTATARERLRYHVTERGLNVSATMQLNGLAAGLRELEVALPRELQLTGASVAGRDLAWHMASDAQDDAARAVVRLGQPVENGRLVLRLTGWAPLVLDQPWRLPKVRVGGTYWTSGEVCMVVDPTLEARGVTPVDCIQTDVGRTAVEAGAAPLLRFDAYLPSAAVDVVIGRRPTDVAARVGTVLQVGEADATGRLTSRLTVDEGSVFALAADVGAGWTIEAVESVPADALGQWYVDRHRDRQVVHVQLTRPVRPQRPTTIVITGRLQGVGLFEPLPIETLELLKWRDVRLTGELLSIHAGEPYDVEPIGQLPAVAADDLSDDDRALLAAATDGRLFDLLAAAPDAAARFAPKHGAYDADVQLDATLDRGQLRQSYRIVCRPHTSGVEELVVRASRPLPAETQWIEASSGLRLRAEPLSAVQPGVSGMTPAGQLWRLRLLRPASGQVVVTTQLAVPCSTRCAVPLLSLPEAAQQNGRVSVRGGDQMPGIDQRGLVPVPLPRGDAVGAAAVRALYAYNPQQIGTASGGPALWIHATSAADAPAGLVARRVLIESFYTAGTTATHRLTYQLDNPGVAEFTLRRPTGTQLTSVWLDDRPVPQPQIAGDPETIRVRLPAGERSPVVAVCLRADVRPLAAGRRLAPPLPETDVPLLAGQWTVWLPEDFAATGPDIQPPAGRFDWRARLFGPWAAGETQAAGSREPGGGTSELLAAGVDDATPAPGAGKRGWRAWHMSFVAVPPAAIGVMHPPATAAWALALFLACVVGGVWLRCRARCFILSAAILAGLCLLLPAAYASLATGAWLGLVASLLVGVWRRPEVEESPTVAMSQLTVAGIVMLALSLATANRAVADEPGAPPAAASSSTDPHIYRILVPVDAHGDRVGTKQYVSDGLLRRLLPRAADGQTAGGRWLLGQAMIQGELVQRGERADVVAGNWTMTFDLDVLARDTTLWLPLVRDEAQWHGAATLDGIATPLEWGADGRRARIHVAEPGRYRLALALEPAAHDDGEGCRGLSLSVPPLRGARLRLTYPATLSGCEVTGSVADRTSVATAGAFVGDLDGSGALAVCWPNEPSPADSDRGLRTSELRWLTIAPDGVQLDVKYVLEGDAERPAALSVVADRRWELVGAGGAATASAEASRSGAQTMRIELPPAGSPGERADRCEVLLRCRLRGGMRLGRLRLPTLRLTSLAVDQYWLVVSADPSLECEAPAGEAVTTGPSDALLALWGPNLPAAVPQLVVADAKSDENWALTVRPNVAESTVDQSLHVAAGRRALRIQYQANVEPHGAERFGFPLSVPADLAIDSVQVSQAGREVPLRFARLDNQRVNVFFTRMATEPYRLVLTGQLPVGQAGRCPVPHVAWANRPAAAVRTLLYRDEQVLVDVHRENLTVAPDRPVDLPPVAWSDRHVATYRLSALAAAAAELVIRPNDVATSGRSVTALTYSGGAWQAALVIRGRVTSGKLGVVRIDVPASWRGPLEVQPALSTGVVTAPAPDGGRTMTIRLPEPLAAGQPLALQVSGSMALAGRTTVAVPDVRLVGGAGWTRYVVVPAEIDGRPTTWSTGGVVPARLPDRALPGTAAAGRVFRVVATPIDVALAPQLAPRPSATVPLVETTALAGAGGGRYAATRMVVVPHGLTQCVLEMPVPWELMRVSVEGHRALVESLGRRRWRVQLNSDHLPQVIAIVSRRVGNGEAGRDVVRLARPTLLAGDRPIPIELSLWSLGGPAAPAMPVVEGAKLATGLEYATWRLERLVGVAEGAMPTAAHATVTGADNWLRPWADVLAAAQRDAVTAQLGSGRQAVSAQVSPSTDDQLASATARADAWLQAADDVLLASLAGPSPTPSRDELAAFAPAGRRWTYCIADGGVDSVAIGTAHAGLSPGENRLIGLAAILGLATMLAWLVGCPAAHDLLWRWPHTAGLLLGLIAWACLQPRWLGLLIGATVLLLVVRPAWPGPTFRADESTVLQRNPTP